MNANTKNIINNIRKIEGKQSSIKDKTRTIEVQWSIQWDDRLSSFYIFCFPTPIIGIHVNEQGGYQIFPVGGNHSMQQEAIRLCNNILQSKGDN